MTRSLYLLRCCYTGKIFQPLVSQFCCDERHESLRCVICSKMKASHALFFRYYCCCCRNRCAKWKSVLLLERAAAISYPESSGFLVSGWAPVETLENSKTIILFDWLPRNGFHCFIAEILR